MISSGRIAGVYSSQGGGYADFRLTPVVQFGALLGIPDVFVVCSEESACAIRCSRGPRRTTDAGLIFAPSLNTVEFCAIILFRAPPPEVAGLCVVAAW